MLQKNRFIVLPVLLGESDLPKKSCFIVSPFEVLCGFVSSSLSIKSALILIIHCRIWFYLPKTLTISWINHDPHDFLDDSSSPHFMANQLGLPHLLGHLPGGTGSGASLEEGGDLPAGFVNGSSVQLEKTTLW